MRGVEEEIVRVRSKGARNDQGPEDEPKVRLAIGAYAKLWEIINALTECELSDLRREVRERQRSRARRRGSK